MTLSLKPKDLKIKDTDFDGAVLAWFYEQGNGFEIVVEVCQPESRTKYIHIIISWRTILASVKRYLASKK